MIFLSVVFKAESFEVEPMFFDAGLMLVDHHTVERASRAGVVKIQIDASAWFNQVVIDFSAGFVHVTHG